MILTTKTRLLCAAWISLATALHAQLLRVANTTLALPPQLPLATGYSTENALGTLTFNAPFCTANAPGETHRLFVAERDGAIQVVTNLSGTPGQAAYFSIASLFAPGETLSGDGENGLLSLVFHPGFASNGTFFVFFSLEADGILHQRLHQISVVCDARDHPRRHLGRCPAARGCRRSPPMKPTSPPSSFSPIG